MEVLSIVRRKKNEHLINDQIREKKVRVVTNDGEMLGIMDSKSALDEAIRRDLDLVMVSPKANPPVCKILDYGKFLFEKQKKEKEMKKNQKIVEVKEIRMTPNIEEHDFNFKAKNAIKFLKAGNKVKASVRFRGREMTHTSLGRDVLDDFVEAMGEYGKIEKKPKMEGRYMSVMIYPDDEK